MELSVSDCSFEQTLLNYPTVNVWLSYINTKKQVFLNFKLTVIDHIIEKTKQLWRFYDRAVAFAPRSYKIWLDYTDTQSNIVEQYLLGDQESVCRANGTYERALLNLWICPVLWENYLTFLGKQHRITLLRNTFNRALQSLPITQHDRIWKVYLPIVRESQSIPTVADAYRRILKIQPERIEDACEYFISKNATKEAAEFLKQLLSYENFQSLYSRPKYYWWSQLASMISADPTIEGAEDILRNGCKEFVIETGRVWTIIANHYARLGRFAEALDLYDQALHSIISATDFALVWEGVSDLLMAGFQDGTGKFDQFESRLLYLIQEREILLQETILRGNKNSVEAWLELAKLQPGHVYEYEPHTRQSVFATIEDSVDPEQLSQVHVLEKAIESIEPSQIFGGSVSDLWISLSVLSKTPYIVLDLALEDEALSGSDLVTIYCYYAEQLLTSNNDEFLEDEENQEENHAENNQKELIPSDNVNRAREVLQRGVDNKRARNAPGAEKMWSFAIDLEWSSGAESSTKAIFEKCLSSKAATTLHVIGYADFLEQCGRPDEMCRVYERGINTAGWPHSQPLWLRYLGKFVNLYKGTRRERTRDLFEEALKQAGKSTGGTLPIYLLYARFEEMYGIGRLSMSIFQRAAELFVTTSGSPDQEDESVLSAWIASAVRQYGVGKAREVYEYAIGVFKDERAAQWCIKYAGLETKLLEFDRARAIWIHGGQFADPSQMPSYWDAYEQFEKMYGTQETYKEMFSQKNISSARFNRRIHIGMAEAGRDLAPEKEEDELRQAEAAQDLLNAGQQIAPTIYDTGKFTALERFIGPPLRSLKKTPQGGFKGNMRPAEVFKSKTLDNNK